MAELTGERRVEIDAPLQDVWAIAADVEAAPAWQGSLREVAVFERDGQDRVHRAEMVNDAKVRQVKSVMRFDYDEPRAMSWEQEKGDTKAVRGGWRFEDLDGRRTAATYWLAVDPGRMLSMLLRGPAESRVREALLGGAAEGLKRQAETRGA